MDAVLDLVKVLADPTAVFTRVGERPRVLAPAAALVVVALGIAVSLRPFYEAGIQTVMSHLTPQQLEKAPSASTQATVGLVLFPLNLIVMLLVGALLLWINVSLLAGDAKYRTLLSVLAYSFVSFVFFSAVSALVLWLRGPASVASMEDLRPALGLDLAYAGDNPFLGALLNSINPFSIYGVWLAGVGVAVTHRVSRPTGYTAAGISYFVGALILSGLATLQGGGARP